MMLLKLPFSFSSCSQRKTNGACSLNPGLNVGRLNDSHACSDSASGTSLPSATTSLGLFFRFKLAKPPPCCSKVSLAMTSSPSSCSSLGARDLGCALLRGAASSAWRVMLERDYPGVEAAPGCSVAALKPLLLAERRRQAAAAAAAAERLRLSPVRQRCWA
jgi:hypothetical protein